MQKASDEIKIKIDEFATNTTTELEKKVSEISIDVEIRIDQATACQPLCAFTDKDAADIEKECNKS